MPIRPGKDESQSDWMSRCVPEMVDSGRPQDQAVAACLQMWRDRDKEHRAYSLLEVKAVKEDQRIITGVATTPEPDRVGDIVEPLGIEFENPSPLLWMHRSGEPVGLVRFKRPTKDGMEFEASLPKVEEPGRLKDRVDEAWQSIKHGLVRAVSIGFRVIESSFMKDGGMRFIKTEVIELSLVTIPANVNATIDTVKSIVRTAPGPTDGAGAASGRTSSTRKVTKMPTIAEQITSFQSLREQKQERMTALMAKAAEESVTLDKAESEEYDTLKGEVEDLTAHLSRLDDLERVNKSMAKPVNGSGSESAAESRGNGTSLVLPGEGRRISVKANVPKGTAFTRYAMAVAASKGNRWEAINMAKQWHDQTPEVEQMLQFDLASLMRAQVEAQVIRAAQPAGDTINTFAAPLVAYQIAADEFIELLRPATIIGRIPNLRRVPFNIQMPRATTGTSVGWVGEGAPKPVSGMVFDTVQMRWAKAAGIVVLTQELVRFSNPSAEAVVRADLIAAMAQFLDRQFVDPSVAAVTNVSPASITNSVTPVTASGVTAAAFFTDVRSLFSNLFAANLSASGGVWIMTSSQALALSLIQNTLGQNVYPTITAEGGTLLGYPVVTSENIPATGNSPADGYPIIFALAREIMLADDGQVVIDASDQASVQMDTAPDSPPTASTSLISLWQLNMVGLRAERWINWLKRRSAAVQYIQNAKYTG